MRYVLLELGLAFFFQSQPGAVPPSSPYRCGESGTLADASHKHAVSISQPTGLRRCFACDKQTGASIVAAKARPPVPPGR